MQPICNPDGRCVRVEVDGEARWGRRDGDEIVLEDGIRIAEGDGRLPGSRCAVEDPRRPPHVRAAVCEEYAARTPPQPSYFVKPPTTLNGHRGPC